MLSRIKSKYTLTGGARRLPTPSKLASGQFVEPGVLTKALGYDTNKKARLFRIGPFYLYGVP